MSKLKDQSLRELPRSTVLAAALWPTLADPKIAAALEEDCRVVGGKKGPLGAMGLKPQATNKPASSGFDYSKVPGLVRKQQP